MEAAVVIQSERLLPGYQEGAGMDSSRNGLLSTLLMTLPLIAVPAMALLRPPGQQPGVSTNSLEAGEDSAEDWLNEDLAEEGASKTDAESLFEEDAPKEKKTRSKKKPAEPDFDELFEDDSVDRRSKTKAAVSAEKKKGPAIDPPFAEATPDEAAPDDADDKETLEDPFINDHAPAKDRRGADRKSPSREDGFEEVPSSKEKDGSEKGFKAEEVVEQLTARGAVRTKWFDAGDRYPVGLAVYFRGRTDDERIRFEAVGQTREECAADVLKQVEEWLGVTEPE